jgi:hypothetical protein
MLALHCIFSRHSCDLSGLDGLLLGAKHMVLEHKCAHGRAGTSSVDRCLLKAIAPLLEGPIGLAACDAHNQVLRGGESAKHARLGREQVVPAGGPQNLRFGRSAPNVYVRAPLIFGLASVATRQKDQGQ